MQTPQLLFARPRCIWALTLFSLTVCALVTPIIKIQAASSHSPEGLARPVEPQTAISDLRQRLVSSSEPEAQARLADLDRLLETARSLHRADGQPIEVRFRYRPMNDGVEAEVIAVSNSALEISLNESCGFRPSHVVVSYLHELTHIAQFAEGRLGYAAPKVPGATRWQAVGNDAVDEAEAYAESFWIAGTTAVECPENLWGFLAAYHEGWNSLFSFVRHERPTLPAYEVRPPRDGTLLLSASPHAELSLRWFLGSVAKSSDQENPESGAIANKPQRLRSITWIY